MNQTEFSSYDLQSRDLSRYDISDWSNLLSTNPDPATVVGSQVNVTGFYLINDSGPGIARFRISCCAIDATPIVLNIDNYDLRIDSWYEISGKMSFDESSSVYVIEVDESLEIPEPENPYVY